MYTSFVSSVTFNPELPEADDARARVCYRAAIQLFSGGKNAGRQTGALSHVVHACVQCSQCPPAFAALETFVALIMFLDSLLRSEH